MYSSKLLVFLLLLSLSSACTPIFGSISNFTQGSYGAITAAALGVIAAFLAIAYFYAKARQDFRLLSRVRGMALTAVVGAILIVGVELLGLFFCSAYEYITGDLLSGSLIDKAWNVSESFDAHYKTYLSFIEAARIEEAKRAVVVFRMRNLPNPFIQLTLTYPQYPEAAVFYQIYSGRSSVLVNLIVGSIYMQKLVLFVLKHFWVGGLLVVGFILRLVPGFREAGDLLITLYVAFAYIYPFLYALTGYAFESLLTKDMLPDMCMQIARIGGYSNPEIPLPLGCSNLGGFLDSGLITLFSMWMPSVVLGVTFQFASSFRKALSFEVE